MAEQIGIVIKNESDRYVQVVTDRRGACGGCQSTPHGCRSCLASAKMESRVDNPLGAELGDLVKVHLSSSGHFTGAAILYLLPIVPDSIQRVEEKFKIDQLKNKGRYYMAKIVRPDGSTIQRLLVDKQTGSIQMAIR